MQPTLNMCRAQEVRQLALAASATLANVKNVAMLAAAAWAKEAAAAERREARHARKLTNVALVMPWTSDRLFSENPDRGFADGDAQCGRMVAD